MHKLVWNDEENESVVRPLIISTLEARKKYLGKLIRELPDNTQRKRDAQQDYYLVRAVLSRFLVAQE